MAGSNKILTVSYGTFSCTLEGFEDSFETMKAIAEYFRDLAADDRYFGAEPAKPDAEMMARIAEREISRRVEARSDARGITLRTMAAPAAAPAVGASAARTTSDGPAPRAPVAAGADRRAASLLDDFEADEEEDALMPPAPAPGASSPPASPPPLAPLAAPAEVESVAAKLQRIRAAVGRAAPAAAAPMPAFDADDSSGRSASAPAEPAPSAYPATMDGTAAESAGGPAEAPAEDGAVTAADLSPQEPAAASAPEEAGTTAHPLADEAQDEPLDEAEMAPTEPSADVAEWDEPEAEAAPEPAAPDDRAEPATEPAPADGWSGMADADAGDAWEADLGDASLTDVSEDAEAAGWQTELGSADAGDAWRDDLGDASLPDAAVDAEAAERDAETGSADAGDARQDHLGDARLTDVAGDAEATDWRAELETADATDAQQDDPDEATLPAEDAEAAGWEAGTWTADADDDGYEDEIAESVLAAIGQQPQGETEDDGWTEAADEGDALGDAASPDTTLAGDGDDGDAWGDDAASAGDDLTDEAFAEDAASPDAAAMDDAQDEDVAYEAAGPSEEDDGFDAAAAYEEAAAWDAADRQDEPGEAASTEDLEAAQDDEAPAGTAPEEDALDETAARHAATAGDWDDEDDALVPAARSGRAILHGQPEADEAAMSRILSETDAHLQEPEGSRRRQAIAQLKAAVAATEAARRMGERPDDGPRAENAFRNDLRQVVRPRRPQLSPAEPRSERPRAIPLKLVASQRVDERGGEVPTEPVRPRRISTAVAEAVPGDSDSFASFAARMKAKDLPDLLEAAAAHAAFVEGAEDFSRPQIMKKVRQMLAEDFSREDGLRTFGTLLRQGRITKVRNGRFQVSEQTRFNPERRAG